MNEIENLLREYGTRLEQRNKYINSKRPENTVRISDNCDEINGLELSQFGENPNGMDKK